MGQLWSSEDVARLLNMSAQNVWDLVAEGRLRAYRLRPKGRLLFRPEEVEAAVEAGRVATRWPEPAA